MTQPRPITPGAKEYFMQIKILHKKLKLEQRLIGELKSKLYAVSSSQPHSAVMDNKHRDFTDLAAQIELMEQRYEAHLQAYQTQRMQALLLIDSLEDELIKAALIHHYINFYTMEQTAEILEYSTRHVQRLIKRGTELAEAKLYAALFASV